MPTLTMNQAADTMKQSRGQVYCPMCTHTVEAVVVHKGRAAQVVPGQKCARCASALDAGVVFRIDRAA